MPKRKTKPDPRYAEQPAVAAIVKMLNRSKGATVAEIAKARRLAPHTVRAVISRIESRARVEVSRTKVESRAGLVYRVTVKATKDAP
jgi:DNA-binding MarR family transcriptional regulator